MKNSIKILSVLLVSMVISVFTYAEGESKSSAPAKVTSSITGKVVDIKTGETLAGVSVSVEGTATKVYTDLDGNFTITELETGSYDLVLSLISYKNSLIENISVQPGNQKVLDVKLDNLK